MEPNETLPSPMDLPPLAGDKSEEQLPPAQIGSERNPELLPPVTTSDNGTPQDPLQTQLPPSQAAKDDDSASSTGQASSSSLSTGAPQIADDVDLIEKEWVEKAKEIVDKTKENPYLQNKAISEIKADYIKKRYNKEVAKSKE